MVARLETDNKVVGLKEVRRAISLDEAKTVYVAKDTDEDLKKKVVEACNNRKIEIVYVETMEELGEICGIDVNAAFAALI